MEGIPDNRIMRSYRDQKSLDFLKDAMMSLGFFARNTSTPNPVFHYTRRKFTTTSRDRSIAVCRSSDLFGNNGAISVDRQK